MNWPWLDALQHCQQQGEPAVLVSVLATAGSTPRDICSKMVVTAQQSYDSIGGGHLEYQAIAQARQMLADGNVRQQRHSFNLGADLGQCCGGKVEVLLEWLVTAQPVLTVFGAGHVAQALMPLLQPLPLTLRWVDSRAEQFPDVIPANVEVCPSEQPEDELPLPSDIQREQWLLIMTHNHQLDYELVRRALTHPAVTYLGVIGSMTKARRFRARLAHRGFSEQQIEHLICPVGLTEIPGKTPHEVAISITAQLLQRLHHGDQHDTERTESA